MEFPDFRKIEMKDKPLFDSFLSKHPPQISEMTFTNLFCWRLSRKHEFVVHKNHLLVSFLENEARRFYQPIGPEPHRIIEEALGMFPESSFERVEKSIAGKVTGFKVAEDRNMFDYMFRVSDLADLPGDKYSQKRNFIKRFSALNPTACVLEEATVKEFLSLQERWCNMRNCEADRSMAEENMALREALRNFKALGIHGVCAWVNEKIEGFAIGERLNPDAFVEHFEKANSELTGVYQYILNEFAKSIPAGFGFLNREQDLGVEGLRKAKMSYHPSKMVEKFSVSLQR
jgi:hypothetical protein